MANHYICMCRKWPLADAVTHPINMVVYSAVVLKTVESMAFTSEKDYRFQTERTLESIYMLVGEGTFEIGDERHVIGAGEAVTFDPHKSHGLINTGELPMRYLVILVKGEN